MGIELPPSRRLLGALRLCVSAALLLQCAAPAAAATIDNVAVQWNSLLTSVICKHGIPFSDANTYYSQMHLAQWHSLLALHNTDLTFAGSQEAVVAYASRAVLAHLLPFEVDLTFDPFLHNQFKSLGVTLSAQQKKLAKQLGEAVALRVVQNRVGGDPGKEFVYDAATAALDESSRDLAPGIYRYEDSPDAPPSRFFTHLGLTKTFLLPPPIAFRKLFLRNYKPPRIPSAQWDVEYQQLKDIGRADWSGRTPEMDNAASFWFTGPKRGSSCTQTTFWATAAIALLPRETPLYDTVLLFTKLHVAIHDATVVASSMQWAFWFWRPSTAYKVGDPDHAARPNWTAWIEFNGHPEYPSLTTAIVGAGAGVLQSFLDSKGLPTGPFTVEGGTAGPACDSSPGIGPRRYGSLAAAVKDAQLGRMYAGHHFNVSVTHGAEIGAIVADYVGLHWGQPGGPSGVLPDASYLSFFAQVPKKAGEFSDLELRV